MVKKIAKLAVLLCGAAALLFASCDNGSQDAGTTDNGSEKGDSSSENGGSSSGSGTLYYLQITPPSNGTVSAGDSDQAAAGSTVTLTLTPEDGFDLTYYAVRGAYTMTEISSWSNGGSGTEPVNGTVTFTMPEEQVIITVTFSASTKGFVKVTGATVSTAVSGSSVFIEGRTLEIPDMYVCEHEVTQKEYYKYCIGNAGTEGDNYPAFAGYYDAIVYCNLRSIREGYSPVYSISGETDPSKWSGARYGTGDKQGKYCGPSFVGYSSEYVNGGNGWQNKEWITLGVAWRANGYRLPTEAEWEYIARGGNGGIPENQTTYAGSDVLDEVSYTDDQFHEIKGKKANSLGIYDMTGNAAEWCYDVYGEITAETSAYGIDWSEQKHQGEDSYTITRVTRGETVAGRSGWSHSSGFRVVRTNTGLAY